MNVRRIGALTGATALTAALALSAALPASAETVIGDYTFYEVADFGTETGAGYPATDWFFGTTSTFGTVTSSMSGLEIAGNGQVQILNNQETVATPGTAGEFLSLLSTMHVWANNTAWTIQLPFFGEPSNAGALEFTTLRPAATGNFTETADWQNAPWITSWAIPGYPAGATAPLSDLVAALYQGEAPQLLAYGLLSDSLQSGAIEAIRWGGTYSMFTQVPTRTVPATITMEEFTTTGLTLTGTNWVPGSDVYVIIEDADGAGVSSAVEGVAGADGTVSVTVTAPTGHEPGTYSIEFDEDGVFFQTGFFPALSFEVTAAAEPEPQPEPELAATGTDSAGIAAGGIGVLVAGALLLTARMRARRA